MLNSSLLKELTCLQLSKELQGFIKSLLTKHVKRKQILDGLFALLFFFLRFTYHVLDTTKETNIISGPQANFRAESANHEGSSIMAFLTTDLHSY